jgi:hypothetical protein
MLRQDNGYARPGGTANLLCEPGQRYLYVDGRCRYWVADPEQAFCADDPRTGVLDRAEEERLAVALAAGAPATARTAAPPGPEDYHASDGERTVNCSFAGAFVGAAELEPACASLRNLHRDLFERGAPLEAPLKLRFETHDNDSLGISVPWPLERDLGGLASSGLSRPVLLEDADEASALRELKNASPYAPVSFLVFANGPESTVWMYSRDVLPFEDANGHVDF